MVKNVLSYNKESFSPKNGKILRNRQTVGKGMQKYTNHSDVDIVNTLRHPMLRKHTSVRNFPVQFASKIQIR